MGNKYSPIKTMRVKNFRNIGDITVDFAESPIVSLIGDNEAGKTSVVKAFAVCALHAYSRDQKEYIRDGTSGFGVSIELESGHIINRIKTDLLNRYMVSYPDGTEWETNKIDAGLPVQVSDLMGLVEEQETKQFLQIRTYEDQLLFVVTPSSTNYKVMYDALKVEQITKAIKLGNEEVNRTKAQMAESEIKEKTLSDRLKDLKIVDMEPVLNVRERLITQLKVLESLERAYKLQEAIEDNDKRLGALKLIAENDLREVDVNSFNMVNTAYNTLNRFEVVSVLCKKYEEIESLENIETATLNKMYNTLSILDVQLKLEKRVENLTKLQGLKEVPWEILRVMEKSVREVEIAETIEKKIEVLKPLSNCRDIGDKIFENLKKMDLTGAMVDRLSLLSIEAEKSMTYVKQVEEYLRKVGAKVITCDNCGGQMVLTDDGEMYHQHEK